jgi:hypothetical protein
MFAPDKSPSGARTTSWMRWFTGLTALLVVLGSARPAQALYMSCADITPSGKTLAAVCAAQSANTVCGNVTVACGCEIVDTIPPHKLCSCDSTVTGAAAAGTACPDDGNSCTSDKCDGYGYCQHALVSQGTACANDSNACTSDSCDGAGNCQHTNASGGKTCGSTSACYPASSCCTDADCPSSASSAGHCSGVGGSCSTSCNPGYFACAGTCISTSTCCANPNSCTGGKTCSGNGGSCACPAGTYDCAGTCIAAATCCDKPNNCPEPTSGTGTGTCSAAGASCTLNCAAGQKQCGSACIPNSQCCADADCPGDSANHRHGICGSGGSCAYACDTGYRPCGASCIPSTDCCLNADCASPLNGCYKATGTCSSGTCSYAYDDGALCNADNDACTPNDRCKSGACVADTANTVKCVQRDCHTAPTCNKSTGNCDDTPLSNGAICGNNGCESGTGTCTAGACSLPAKDCSALNGECAVGICDAAAPSGAPCTTANKMNGLGCALADKCMTAPACNGGACIGTPKICDPSAECRIAMCNSATGDCDETVAAVGTACTPSTACVQGAHCDATGACVGDTVPDGTPCVVDGCGGAGSCLTGTCTCMARPNADGPAPIVPGGAQDMSTGGTGGKGCAFAGNARGDELGAFGILLALSIIARRRRAF